MAKLQLKNRDTSHFPDWNKNKWDVSLILILFLIFFLVINFSGNCFAVEPSTGPVKVEGRRLLADFDRNGQYEPFFIKGAGYSPYPIGRHPSDWGWPPGDPREDNIFNDTQILVRDFSLLQAMHCNAIRIWKGDDTQEGTRFPCKLTQRTLDLAEAHNIKVIAGFWVNSSGPQCINGEMVYYAPDFTNPSARDDLLIRFEAYVNTFKNHPAILFWAIGNENNLHLDPDNQTQIQAWFSLVNEMAQRAHNAEGADYHPVAVVNGDLGYIGNSFFGASDNQLPNLDIWGSNVYRGISFGDLFSEFTAKTNKPLWISEYGMDSWHTNNYIERGDGFQDGFDGYEAQDLQANWDVVLWDEIVLNNDVTIGAALMAYSDEWWKPYEWIDGGIHNSTQDHFGTGPKDTSCPKDGLIDWYPPSEDNFFNDEWWGFMSISQNPSPFSPDIMSPKQVYYKLQNRFQCGVENGMFYVGPDNGKSCDGTSACCDTPLMKAKKGACFSNCSISGKKIIEQK